MAQADLPWRRQRAFSTCGDGLWILRHRDDETRLKLALDTCNDRWCVPCQRDRSFRIRENLQRNMPDHPIRFLTLTIKSHDEPLRALLARLYKGFRRLRNSALWKDRVEGGVAFLEVTRGKRGDHWHPHLHVLLQGRYLPADKLRATWLRVTGDSHVLHITLLRRTETVHKYVTKYCTKTTSPDLVRHPAALQEAVETMTGVRTIVPFGTWHAWKLLRHEPTGEWILWAHEDDLARRDYDGDEVAHYVLLVLRMFDRQPGLEFHWRPAPDDGDLPPPEDFPPKTQSVCQPKLTPYDGPPLFR